MNRVLESLPPAERRMYLLQPKRFLTDTSLLEAVRSLADPAERADNTAGEPAAVDEEIALEDVVAALEEARAAGQLDLAVAAFRPILDYSFFAALTAEIDSGRRSVDLTELRSEVLAALDRIDAAVERDLGQAVDDLRTALQSPDPVAWVKSHPERVTPAFLLVVNANIAAMGDENILVSRALGSVRDAAVELAEQAMDPRDRLASRLARAESDEQRMALLDSADELANADLAADLRHAAAEARSSGAGEVAGRLEAAASLLERRLGLVVAT
jgi:hypothetical protein